MIHRRHTMLATFLAYEMRMSRYHIHFVLQMCQNSLLDYLEPTTKHHDGLQPVAILIHL